MKTIGTVFTALFLTIAVPVAALADAVEDQVKAAYSAWDEAFNKGNAKAVAAFYTDDAKLLPPNHEIIEGPAGAEKFFSGLIGNGVTGHKLELITVSDRGDLAIGAAKWSANGKDAQGQPAKFSGVATHVFEKQPAGTWKLKLHTFN